MISTLSFKKMNKISGYKIQKRSTIELFFSAFLSLNALL
jgi:hypothetical protein